MGCVRVHTMRSLISAAMYRVPGAPCFDLYSTGIQCACLAPTRCVCTRTLSPYAGRCAAITREREFGKLVKENPARVISLTETALETVHVLGTPTLLHTCPRRQERSPTWQKRQKNDIQRSELEQKHEGRVQSASVESLTPSPSDDDDDDDDDGAT